MYKFLSFQSCRWGLPRGVRLNSFKINTVSIGSGHDWGALSKNSNTPREASQNQQRLRLHGKMSPQPGPGGNLLVENMAADALDALFLPGPPWLDVDGVIKQGAF